MENKWNGDVEVEIFEKKYTICFDFAALFGIEKALELKDTREVFEKVILSGLSIPTSSIVLFYGLQRYHKEEFPTLEDVLKFKITIMDFKPIKDKIDEAFVWAYGLNPTKLLEDMKKIVTPEVKPQIGHGKKKSKKQSQLE